MKTIKRKYKVEVTRHNDVITLRAENDFYGPYMGGVVDLSTERALELCKEIENLIARSTPYRHGFYGSFQMIETRTYGEEDIEE